MNFNMKKLDSITAVLLFALVLFSLMAFTTYNSDSSRVSEIPCIEIKTDTIIIVKSQRELFLDVIGHQESGNRYHIVNRYGYMGKYQFGKSTLRTLRIKVSRSEFLKDTLLQEEAMLKLLLHNKKRLQKYIDKYEGKVVHGILVTESGLLAAAHLGGQGSVKKWFRNGRIRKDGNGVKITSYMKRFGGYILNL
tara:strand:- start:520 stop:1098 length:579 start_codon:yes stop_codon:yes gene_type:complete